MSSTPLMLSVLVTMVLLLFISPGIFASNRGRVLRNISLWLAIFVGLALVYKSFGPDSPHPLFQLPETMKEMPQKEDQSLEKSLPSVNDTKDDKDTGEQGFTPRTE